MRVSQIRLLVFYLYGYALVALQAVGVAVLLLWALQVFALALGEQHDWHAVLVHLILTVNFAAFYPGQTFWTFRLAASDGTEHTIIGDPKTDDQPEA